MNKSLILNFEVLKELRISVEELLYLFHIFNNIEADNNIDLNQLENKKFSNYRKQKDYNN